MAADKRAERRARIADAFRPGRHVRGAERRDESAETRDR